MPAMNRWPGRRIEADLEAARAARLGPRAARLMRLNDWYVEHPVRFMLIGVPVGGIVAWAFMFTFAAVWHALPIAPR